MPGSRGVNLRKEVAGKPLQDHLVRGFEYSDCWAQDAKLVALNAMDLVQRGARFGRKQALSARIVLIMVSIGVSRCAIANDRTNKPGDGKGCRERCWALG